MKRAAELVIVNKFKATTEEEKITAVKRVLVDLVVREWQKKN